MNPNGLILMHDASSHLATVRDAAKKMEQEGLISTVLLPTPRGLVIATKTRRTQLISLDGTDFISLIRWNIREYHPY